MTAVVVLYSVLIPGLDHHPVSGDHRGVAVADSEVTELRLATAMAIGAEV